VGFKPGSVPKGVRPYTGPVGSDEG
jgi:hypothetical protein